MNKIISYHKGLKHGPEIHRYPNGKMAKNLFYFQGRPEGIQKAFFPSGKKKYIKYFKAGKHDKEATEWHENGKVFKFTLYQNGEIRAQKQWRRNGRIFHNYIYEDGEIKGLKGGRLCFSAKDKKR